MNAVAQPGPSLVVADAAALSEGLPIEPGKVRSHILRRGTGTMLVGVAIDEGAEMREHVARVPILIQVVDGLIRLDAAGEAYELPPGAIIEVPAELRHAVRGLAPSRFLIQMLGEADAAAAVPMPAPLTLGAPDAAGTGPGLA